MQKDLMKLYKPGFSIREINLESEILLEAALSRLGLITRTIRKDKTTLGITLKKYLPHGIAHHIGLDVHDPGDKETPLQKGMLLSCEPGLYIREENMGIRLENDILVSDSPVDISSKIPVEPGEIEAIMNSR
jgi:Xaa-Pro aminopeptidase